VDKLPIAGTIQRIRDLASSGVVPIANSSHAEYVTDSSGQQWIRKHIDSNEFLAEATSFLLCVEIGAPVPHGAYFRDSDRAEPKWLSKKIPDVVQWSKGRAQCLVNPADLGTILAVDAIVGNWDRNQRNLLLQPEPTADRLRVYGIDFADSTIGHPKDFREMGLQPPPIDALVRGIPVDMIRGGAMKSASKLQKVADSVLRRIVLGSCAIVAQRDSDIIAEALVSRCADATSVVREHLARIEKRA
jgi:hypothetical protein